MKKKTGYERHQQKLARAAHKIEFFRKIKYICDAAGGPDVYPLILQKDLELLYISRILPFKIIAAPGADVPIQILNSIRDTLQMMMKEEKFPLIKDGPLVSLHVLYFVVFIFLGFLDKLDERSSPAAARLKRALVSLGIYQERQMKIMEEVNSLFLLLGVMNSTYDTHCYWLSSSMQTKCSGTWGIEEILTVHVFDPPRKHMLLDGISRPVMRVCLPLPGGEVNDASVAPADIGISDSRLEKRYDVYIQSHVLKRLHERLDCVDVSILHLHIYLSLCKPKVIKKVDGTILVEYRIDGKKFGYFRASLHQDVLILRTFLFITNDGTPEGMRLNEICGLRRLDKQYLSMDKYGSFMNPELKNSPELRSLFQQAGCEDLLESYSEMQKYSTENSKPVSPQTMVKYLRLDKQKDFLTMFTEANNHEEEVYIDN
jgi:hypothetical protein